jgi:tetratricopeptide (TPR) repeat protein
VAKLPLIAVLSCLVSVTASTAAAQEPAKDAYSRAVELETQGNYEAALPLLWDAGGLAPHDADIQNRLGEALERIGALDASIDAYRRAVTERPSFKKASNNLILALVKTGRGEQAVARARAIVAAAPRDADSYFTLGLAQSEQDVTESIKSFRHALELDPRHTLARYNLALALKRIDQLSEAADELSRAIAIEPRPEALYTLGVVYWHQGHLDRAADALRNAVEKDPGYADAYSTLGAVLKEKRDWSSAATALHRAITLRPDLSAAHYTLGQVLDLSGDSAAAKQEFAEAERLRKQAQLAQEAGVWTTVATQKLDVGDLMGALDSVRHALAVFDSYALAHYQMGRVLDRLGEREAASAAFARARQLNPSLVPPRERSK